MPAGSYNGDGASARIVGARLAHDRSGNVHVTRVAGEAGSYNGDGASARIVGARLARDRSGNVHVTWVAGEASSYNGDDASARIVGARLARDRNLNAHRGTGRRQKKEQALRAGRFLQHSFARAVSDRTATLFE